MEHKKTLILIHGRSFKPDEKVLKSLWIEALTCGIDRDHGRSQKLDSINVEFIYYGDLSYALLVENGKRYERDEDLEERREALDELKNHSRCDFLGSIYKSRRRTFHKIRTGLAKAVVRIPLLRDIGMSSKMPDMAHYWWKSQREFGIDLRKRLSKHLSRSIKAQDDVMIISHSLGTIVAYDVLSAISEKAVDCDVLPHPVTHLVTLGSPLGVGFVQKRLRKWRKLPVNITNWHNVTAQDDYVALDSKVADDFQEMNTCIRDYSIYNLTIKEGKLHQHHATGYLIHPVVAKIVRDWLD